MSDTLSVTAQAVLREIVAYIAEHGYAPSRREIAERCGFASTRSADVYVVQLVRAGAVRVDYAVPRGLVVLHADKY